MPMHLSRSVNSSEHELGVLSCACKCNKLKVNIYSRASYHFPTKESVENLTGSPSSVVNDSEVGSSVTLVLANAG